MRGLTPAERALLARVTHTHDTGEDDILDVDADESEYDNLIARGSITRHFDEDWIWWEPTDAGRLALRLWPATAATPGAGGQ